MNDIIEQASKDYEVQMSAEELQLRAELMMAKYEAKEYKEALERFKESGRPITLPNNLTPNEFNQMLDYMAKQQKVIGKEINRQKRLKK